MVAHPPLSPPRRPTAAVPVARLPFNADLGIPKEVWDGMGPLAQAAAAAAGAQRAELARSLPLRELGEELPATEASQLGVTVLGEDRGKVSLGLFTLPTLNDAVQDPPKSEWRDRCFSFSGMAIRA